MNAEKDSKKPHKNDAPIAPMGKALSEMASRRDMPSGEPDSPAIRQLFRFVFTLEPIRVHPRSSASHQALVL
jgi:hypothetical protein